MQPHVPAATVPAAAAAAARAVGRSRSSSSSTGRSPATSSHEEEAAAAAVQLSDLECSVCLGLLCEPITTPCGHTMCRLCLARALRRQATCPTCRSVSTIRWVGERAGGRKI